MDVTKFYTTLKNEFPHNPTPTQDIALNLLAKFVLAEDQKEIFLLKGYAGTGKTTLVGLLVQNLYKKTSFYNS